eukprot:7224175-Ditylum_brightwellii.AAC.2
MGPRPTFNNLPRQQHRIYVIPIFGRRTQRTGQQANSKDLGQQLKRGLWHCKKRMLHYNRQ